MVEPEYFHTEHRWRALQKVLEKEQSTQAALESLACGTPVIVGDNTAPAWVCGKAGLRVNATDSDAIAAGIERMVAEDAWRRQASAVGLQRAAKFSWEQAARRTMEVYERALERHGAAAATA